MAFLSPSINRTLAARWIILGFIFQLMIHVNTSNAYILPAAEEGGTCAGRQPVIDDALVEARNMIDKAIESLETLLGPPPEPYLIKPVSTRWKNRKRIAFMFRSVFPFEVDKKYSIKAEDRGRVEQIQTRYKDMKAFLASNAPNPDKWRLCCDEHWAEAITEIPKEGLKGTEMYAPGTPVDTIGNYQGRKFILWDKWQPDKEISHVFDPQPFHDPPWTKTGRCDKEGDPATGASRLHAFTIRGRKTVTICPWAFERSLLSLKDLLGNDAVSPITRFGGGLDDFRSISTTIIHETSHVLHQTFDHAYYFKGCEKVANDHREAEANQKDISVADCYPEFALAMYLSSRDWSTGFPLPI